MNPMQDALSKRRGKGLDLTISVGSPKDDKTDIGPSSLKSDESEAPSEMMGEGHEGELGQLAQILKNNPKALEYAKQLIAEAEPTEESPEEEAPTDGNLDKELTSSMTDYDREDLEKRKPRSLGEAARKAAMGRMKA